LEGRQQDRCLCVEVTDNLNAKRVSAIIDDTVVGRTLGMDRTEGLLPILLGVEARKRRKGKKKEKKRKGLGETLGAVILCETHVVQITY